jgi:hypothetical protein
MTRSKPPALRASATILCFCLSCSVASAEYLSLAVVGGQGLDFHGVGKGVSRESAEDAALADCRNPRCKTVMTYGPGQCAHIVTGARQIFWNTKLFSARETEYVVADCNKADSNCQVLRSECLPEASSRCEELKDLDLDIRSAGERVKLLNDEGDPNKNVDEICHLTRGTDSHLRQYIEIIDSEPGRCGVDDAKRDKLFKAREAMLNAQKACASRWQ